MLAALGFALTLLFCLLFAASAQAASMYVLRDDATGGDCTAIGSWDNASKTCTMTTDVSVLVAGDTGIEIVDDNLRLDGAGHQITGLGATFPPPDPGVWVPEYGVVLNSVAGVRISNLAIHDIDAGIQINGGNTNLVIDSEIRDCSHGVWLVLSTGNAVANSDFIDNIWAGVDLVSANDNLVSGNTIASSTNWGVRMFEADGNTLSGNLISNRGTAAAGTGTAVYIYYSDNNTVMSNTLSSANYGVHIDAGADNDIWVNSFRGNVVQADDAGGNIFNLAAPTGGNHWDDFDEPAEGCMDISPTDGFCDSPYVFSGNQDNLPRIAPCPECPDDLTIPTLSLSLTSVYWGSYTDYTAGLLSIDYSIANSGASNAFNVQITNATATNGVIPVVSLPIPVGDIAAGGSAPVTIQYTVPGGVGSFVASLIASAEDSRGITYTYP